MVSNLVGVTDRGLVAPGAGSPTGVLGRWLDAVIRGDDGRAWELTHPVFRERMLGDLRGQGHEATPELALRVLRGSREDVEPGWSSLPVEINGDTAVVTLVDAPVGHIPKGSRVVGVSFRVDHTDAGWRVWGVV